MPCITRSRRLSLFLALTRAWALLIGVILSFGTAPHAGATDADLLLDMETGANGDVVSSTNLTNGSHLAATPGTWSTWISGVPSALTNTKIGTAAEFALRGTVTVNGSNYADVGATRGITYDLTSNPAESMVYAFPSTVANASMGFFFRTTLTYQNFNSYTLARINASDGSDYAAFNFEDFNAGDFTARVETFAGTSGTIALNRNVTYWITLRYVKNDNAYLEIYETAGYTLVGSASLVLGNVNAGGIDFGKVGGSGVFPTGLVYYDDVMVDYTTASFPLMPGSPPAIVGCRLLQDGTSKRLLQDGTSGRLLQGGGSGCGGGGGAPEMVPVRMLLGSGL